MTAFVSSFFQAGIEVSLYHDQGSQGRRRPPRLDLVKININFSTSSTLLTLLALTFGMDQEKNNKNQKIYMASNE